MLGIGSGGIAMDCPTFLATPYSYISGTSKADFRFGRQSLYIHRVHPIKSPLKFWRKESVGAARVSPFSPAPLPMWLATFNRIGLCPPVCSYVTTVYSVRLCSISCCFHAIAHRSLCTFSAVEVFWQTIARYISSHFIIIIITARCYAERGYEIACRLSVRLSVCP